MEAFTSIDGLVVPMDRANVDTDQIIPKQYLKSIKRTGFGPNLFDDWRYLDPGEPGEDHSRRRLNADFEFNQKRYQGAQVLLARKNFGCGSSREHAPWALLDYGIRVLVAPSYADIFYNNCCKNGILPVVQDEQVIDELFKQTRENEGYRLRVDLEQQTLSTPTDVTHHFDIDAGTKYRLLKGLDDIGMTLQYAEDIKRFEEQRRTVAPWLFTELS